MIFHGYVSLPEGNLDDDPSTSLHHFPHRSFFSWRIFHINISESKVIKSHFRIRSQRQSAPWTARKKPWISLCSCIPTFPPSRARAGQGPQGPLRCGDDPREGEPGDAWTKSWSFCWKKNTMVSCVSWRPPFFYSGLLGFVILL